MLLSDRRRHPRFPFHTRGSLLLDGCSHQGTLLDISLKGGLFVPDANPAVPVGRDCLLRVFHGGKEKFVELPGSVVYIHAHLIGIDFDPVSEDALRWFQQVILLNLAIPALLHRDLPALLSR